MGFQEIERTNFVSDKKLSFSAIGRLRGVEEGHCVRTSGASNGDWSGSGKEEKNESGKEVSKKRNLADLDRRSTAIKLQE